MQLLTNIESLKSNTVIVGAPFDGASQTGSVLVYSEVSENNWELLDSKIVGNDSSDGDQFGISVDVDDLGTFVIGSNVSISLSCRAV